MDVFISWSKEKSGEIANVIAKYLRALINQTRPWLSSKDISTGARWSAEIASKLESSQVGIVCLTAENQHEPWILFEAGAIAKLTTVGRAMVLRINLKSSEVTGPLSQFQSVGLDKEGISKLVGSINSAGGNPVSEDTLKLSFEAFWPKMKEEFDEILKKPSTTTPTKRSDQEILEELVTMMRRTDMRQQNAEVSFMAQLVEIRQRLPSNLIFGSLESNNLSRLSAIPNAIYWDTPTSNVPVLLAGDLVTEQKRRLREAVENGPSREPSKNKKEEEK